MKENIEFQMSKEKDQLHQNTEVARQLAIYRDNKEFSTGYGTV